MATYKTKCPICNSTIEATYYAESIGVVEELINCDRCGFTYEFACGNYAEVVGNKFFIWNYIDERKSNRSIYKKIKRAEFTARRRWKKYKKGVTCKNCPI